MPFPAGVKETPDASEATEVKEAKKAKKLPPYKYTALKNADTLRLLRLRPANDTQLDIDCEIVEIDLPKKGDAPRLPLTGRKRRRRRAERQLLSSATRLTYQS
jgi:hypothetical protein